MICLSCHQKTVVSKRLSSSTMEEESFNGTATAGHIAGGLGLSKTSLLGQVLNAPPCVEVRYPPGVVSHSGGCTGRFRLRTWAGQQVEP